MARLANAISTVKTSVSFCEECGNVSETKLCTICRDERRDPSVLCVVEESKDVVAIELTRSFTGRYHVLGGAINPLAGVGPEQLRIRELVSRLADERIQEIILAMDPNLEGEATEMCIRDRDAPDEETRERQILNTIRFIQMGLGARFDAEGNPVRLDSEESLPEQSPVQEAGLKVAS